MEKEHLLCVGCFPRRACRVAHLMDEKTETQRGKVTCPKRQHLGQGNWGGGDLWELLKRERGERQTKTDLCASMRHMEGSPASGNPFPYKLRLCPHHACALPCLAQAEPNEVGVGIRCHLCLPPPTPGPRRPSHLPFTPRSPRRGDWPSVMGSSARAPGRHHGDEHPTPGQR